MALDKTAKVKMKFEADTRPARRELDKLDKKQTKTAKSSVQSSKAAQKGIEAQTAAIGKMTLAIGATVLAIKGVSEAAKKFAKEAQLEQAAKGFNVKAIQKATRGLITEYEALSFAAAAANTDFKVSQTDMENAAKAMISLRNQGNDLTTVMDVFTKSIVEGNVRGLRQLGVILHGSSGKVDSFTKVMKRLAGEAEKPGATMEIAGDKALIAANRFEDASRQMSLAAGRLAIALTPVLDIITKIVQGWGIILTLGKTADAGSGDSTIAQFTRLKAERTKVAAAIASGNKSPRQARFVGFAGSDFGGVGARSASVAKQHTGDSERLRSIDRELAKLRETLMFTTKGKIALGLISPRALGPDLPPGGLPAGGGGGGAGGMGRITSSLRGGRVSALPSGSAGPVTIPGLDTFQGPGVGGLSTQAQGFFAGLEGSNMAQGARSAAETNREALAATEAAQHLSNAGSQALNTFASNAVSAFAAFADGSKSAKEAFKDFMAGSLKGLSAELSSLAISSGVKALMELASPLPGARGRAAFYGKAAAAAAAGAVVVGQLAGQFGSSGNPPPPETTGAGGGGAISSASGGTGSSITVFVGSDFSDNPRSNASRLSRTFARGRQMEGDESVVTFS